MKEEDNILKTAKVEMDEAREENERLKLTLSQMMKEYQSLKMQFNDITSQLEDDSLKLKSTDLASMSADDDESELVSLSLGHSSREEKKLDISCKYASENPENGKVLDGLQLELESKFSSSDQVFKNLRPENSGSDETKEEENGDISASCHKSPKISRSEDNEEILMHNPLKKPRVSVRAVCNTQTMNDGCQWRKYGQKTAKGNPCPRAYYRCTVSSSCPVRKHVQRCIDDMTILVTTYEGSHNHPLPPSATTMASATSAAVAMLNCGPTATSPPCHDIASATTSNVNPLGFNINSSNKLMTTSHFPRATISSLQSHPTVILDLTKPNHLIPPKNSLSSTSTHYYSNKSLIFSSPKSCFVPNTPQLDWRNKFPNTKDVKLPYYHEPSLHKNIIDFVSQKGTTSEDDQRIAAATEAITCDPSFQSALAAAITSFVGTNVQERDSGLGFHNSFLQPSTGNGSNFSGRRLDPQQNMMTHFTPLTKLSTSKSHEGVFLADEGEQLKVLGFGI